VRRVVETLKDYVNLWCTINEPNIFATMGYFMGFFPPGKKDVGAYSRVTVNLVRAHAAAYRAIHSLQPHARAGAAINYRSMLPAKSWFPLDGWVAKTQSVLYNDAFARALLDGWVRLPLARQRVAEAKGTHDYIGVNYYSRDYVSFNLLQAGKMFARRAFRAGADLSPTGFIANEPEGMFESLKWARQFNVPIIITENGVEDPEDQMRPRYLAQHLQQVWRAVNFNWPVKGYYHWSLVDNFEWERGWSQRFGLWELDVETQGRKKRPSADFFAEVCRENGLSADMVARYAPEVFAQMFPN
jgi:beta-glucosidase